MASYQTVSTLAKGLSARVMQAFFVEKTCSAELQRPVQKVAARACVWLLLWRCLDSWMNCAKISVIRKSAAVSKKSAREDPRSGGFSYGLLRQRQRSQCGGNTRVALARGDIYDAFLRAFTDDTRPLARDPKLLARAGVSHGMHSQLAMSVVC